MRCAWCEREAVDGIADEWTVPSCGRRECSVASADLFDARMRWCVGLGVGGYALSTEAALRPVVAAVIARDAAEQRGEPADTSGWLLW